MFNYSILYEPLLIIQLIKYIGLFIQFMQFCDGEEDTQCCFFENEQNQLMKLIKNNEASNLKFRNGKSAHAPHKEVRLICKSNKKQKSQEKGKLSLSKMSQRRATSNNNRQKMVSKQPIEHLKISRMPYQKSPNLNKIEQYRIYNETNPTNIVLVQKNHQIIYHQQNHTIDTYKNYGNNYPQQIKDINLSTFNQLHFRQYNLMNQSNNKEAVPYFPQFQDGWVPPTLQSSLRPASYRMIKHRPAPPPSGTGHQFQNAYDQNKSLHQNLIADFSSHLSTIKHANQATYRDSVIENVPETQGKLYPNELSPKLETAHLKTVQSVYSQQMSIRKEINESIIIMDFFNPSNEVKKQMENRLHMRIHDSYML